MTITDPDTNKRIPLESDLALKFAAEVKVWNAGVCTHNTTEYRRGFNRAGGPVVRAQCLDCGELVGNPIKRTPETENLNEIDLNKHLEYQNRRRREWEEICRRYTKLQSSRWSGNAEGKSYFQRSHEEYLSSPEWAERRLLVIERSSGLCEGCRKAQATEVHHRSYENWGNEFLFELLALCSACHDRIHHVDQDQESVCKDCVHGDARGEWCLNFDMPTSAALVPNGACGPERESFVPDEHYGQIEHEPKP